MKPKGAKTKIIEWRAENFEFCRGEGLGLNDTHPARPPWWVVRYRGFVWDACRWNYLWVGYGGPPKIFLTRKNAEKEAKAFREQYGGGKQFGNGPLKVEVIKIMPSGETA